MKTKIKLVALLLATTSAFFAQETKTTFGGNADFYYKYDFANTDQPVSTSFTNSHDSFELGMVSVKASHKTGKASIVADLGFGRRAAEFSYNDTAFQFAVKQLNITYEFDPSFKVTAGSFATHLGYELVDATDNKNYSMSYAFTNGPFFNTGIKAQYTSGKFSMMAGLTNPTDFKTAIQAKSKQKTFIAQLAYVADKSSIYFNFTTGGQNTSLTSSLVKTKTQFDLVATTKVTDDFTLAFNGTFAKLTLDAVSPSPSSTSWFSGLVYANYALTKKHNLAYRFEYLGDKDGQLYAKDNNIISNSLSLNFKEGNFTFIPEVRFDSSSQEIFAKNDLSPSKSNAYALIACTYAF